MIYERTHGKMPDAHAYVNKLSSVACVSHCAAISAQIDSNGDGITLRINGSVLIRLFPKITPAVGRMSAALSAE